jgi:hypothetical protein
MRIRDQLLADKAVEAWGLSLISTCAKVNNVCSLIYTPPTIVWCLDTESTTFIELWAQMIMVIPRINDDDRVQISASKDR